VHLAWRKPTLSTKLLGIVLALVATWKPLPKLRCWPFHHRHSARPQPSHPSPFLSLGTSGKHLITRRDFDLHCGSQGCNLSAQIISVCARPALQLDSLRNADHSKSRRTGGSVNKRAHVLPTCSEDLSTCPSEARGVLVASANPTTRRLASVDLAPTTTHPVRFHTPPHLVSKANHQWLGTVLTCQLHDQASAIIRLPLADSEPTIIPPLPAVAEECSVVAVLEPTPRPVRKPILFYTGVESHILTFLRRLRCQHDQQQCFRRGETDSIRRWHDCYWRRSFRIKQPGLIVHGNDWVWRVWCRGHNQQFVWIWRFRRPIW
jgi:hypothetical protein